MNTRIKNVLFITWDGPQVSYLEGLFLPIFERLLAYGWKFHVLQFTWGPPESTAQARIACEVAGIPFRSISVWRRAGGIGPFASALVGRRHIRRAVRNWGIDTLMPRSVMPAVAVLAMRDRAGLNILFDADGFAVDERVDFGGLSSQSWTYRILRDVEAQMVRVADAVLVRSQTAIPILAARAGAGTDSEKFFVVSNGRDPAPYTGPTGLKNLPREGQSSDKQGFTLCYAGSVGKQYYPERMLAVALALKQKIPDLRFLVLTGDAQNILTEITRMKISATDWIDIRCVPPDQVGPALMECDLALAFRKQSFSTQGVAPIKLGEYMLAGLPIIGTAAVGNVDELIRQDVFLPSDGQNNDEITRWVIERVIPAGEALRDQCRDLGQRLFSIDQSVVHYMNALKALPEPYSSNALRRNAMRGSS